MAEVLIETPEGGEGARGHLEGHHELVSVSQAFTCVGNTPSHRLHIVPCVEAAQFNQPLYFSTADNIEVNVPE